MVLMPDSVVDNGRYVWLDFLKGLAIVAVIVNHVFDARVPIHPSALICQFSFYSVSLFVLCGGVSAAISLRRSSLKGEGLWHKSVQRIWKLLLSYTIALLITDCITEGKLDFCHFVSLWFTFPGQFYFVLFFGELLLIAPVLYGSFLRLRGRFWSSSLLLLFMMGLSWLCTCYTYVLPVYGGGRCLFGGSYLWLFCVGLFLWINHESSVGKVVMSLGVVLAVPITIVAMIKFLAGGARGLVWALNPPGLLYICYALALLIVLYFFLRNRRFQESCVVRAGEWLDRRSLDIFLYHMIVLIVLRKLAPGLTGWTWAICCCVLMLIGSAAMGNLVSRAQELCCRCY